eukprot:760044-Hanusia_phi.AAC.3
MFEVQIAWRVSEQLCGLVYVIPSAGQYHVPDEQLVLNLFHRQLINQTAQAGRTLLKSMPARGFDSILDACSDSKVLGQNNLFMHFDAKIWKHAVPSDKKQTESAEITRISTILSSISIHTFAPSFCTLLLYVYNPPSISSSQSCRLTCTRGAKSSFPHSISFLLASSPCLSSSLLLTPCPLLSLQSGLFFPPPFLGNLISFPSLSPAARHVAGNWGREKEVGREGARMVQGYDHGQNFLGLH